MFHYHPFGADFSFTCGLVLGTDGAAYVVIAIGQGVRNGRMEELGMFDSEPELIVIPIRAAGQITFHVTATKGGKSATDMETYTVPTPGPKENEGRPTCRE